MKKILILFAVVALASCSKVKDWKCTVKFNSGGGWSDGSVVYFTGTKDEMKSYEKSGTYDSPLGYSVKTNCK